MSLFKSLLKFLGRRENTSSSSCNDVCDKAQAAAQSAASTGVCSDDFRAAIEKCDSCLNATETNVGNKTTATSPFGQYWDFCDTEDTTSITQVVVVQTRTSVDYVTVDGKTVPISTTMTLLTETLENRPATNSTSITTTSSASVVTTENNLMPSAEPTATTNLDSESKAWVAGPIVGSISGIAILALAAYVIRRRRRRIAKRKLLADEYTGKPQLHSDDVPRRPPEELDAGMRHELPGDEPRDENAVVTELLGEDPRKLDKAYGRSELPLYEPEQLP